MCVCVRAAQFRQYVPIPYFIFIFISITFVVGGSFDVDFSHSHTLFQRSNARCSSDNEKLTLRVITCYRLRATEKDL